jgi:hypothetical protein
MYAPSVVLWLWESSTPLNAASFLAGGEEDRGFDSRVKLVEECRGIDALDAKLVRVIAERCDLNPASWKKTNGVTIS